ncbi:transcription elongation factor GreA [candidate division FCPU426 bacterium]|nr:transcription elongation factor GreA [candidate division FCPU426 bacterium]
MEKVYLTAEGYQKLKAELEHLQGPRRREVVQAIQTAREHGDLSENAEYDAAKEEQAKLEFRISQLQEQLAKAQVIDKTHIPDGRVSQGQQVRVLDLQTQEEMEYYLVAPAESDFAKQRISVTSPIGKGLIGKKIGDEVEIKIPAGVKRYRIISITMV